MRTMKCFCVHEYQDKKYGLGVRLWNKYLKGWRCTVCGREFAETGEIE